MRNILVPLFVFCLFFSPPLSAQNLVTNGEFDTSLSNWFETTNTDHFQWDSFRDRSNSTSSGSVNLFGFGSAESTEMAQCINLPTPAPLYSLEGWVFIHSTDSDPGEVSIGARFFDSAGCLGLSPLNTRIFVQPGDIPNDTWRRLTTLEPIAPPATVRSVQVYFYLFRFNPPAQTLVANFDGISLAPAGPAASVTVDAPTSGFVNELLSLSARGENCSIDNPRSGWQWNVGPTGTIRGQDDAATIGVSFSSPGAFTVSATNPLCGSESGSALISIALRGPQVVIGNRPDPIVQRENEAGGTTSYVLTNRGDSATTITLTQSGTFFTQDPSSFTLAAGASQRVTITGQAVAAGTYDGASMVSGTGVPSGSSVPVSLLSSAPAPSDVDARPQWNRVDVSGTGATSTGSIRFTNPGSAPLQGLLTSSQPWLRPDSESVTIGSGSSTDVTFTIDRSRRPASQATVFGDLTLSWASEAGSVAKQTSDGAPSLGAPVSITDTVPPPVSASGIPALSAGEVALFLPGIGHVVGSVGTFVSDLSVANLTRGETLQDLAMYFNPIGGAPSSAQATSLAGVVPNAPLAYSDLVNTVFGSTSSLGSLQVRSSGYDKVSVSANVFNASNPQGTFGTLIPTIRSDRAAGAGEAVYLAGLRADAAFHTNLYIQETSGNAVTVQTDFLSEAGSSLGSRTDEVSAFGLVQLSAVAPAGAVTAVLTNTGGTGSFFAYATPVDKESGDTWAVSDWARQFGFARTETIVLPVSGSLRGANETFFRTDVVIFNPAGTTAIGNLRYVPRDGQVIDKPVSISARQTLVLDDATGNFFGVSGTTVGFIQWIPTAGEVVITSRNFTTSAVLPGTFGTAVPSIGMSRALQLGDLTRMAGIEDASLSTISDGRPATFRTNFGLVETAGAAATVRVTIRYEFNSSLAAGRGSAFAEYSLAPNQFLQVNNLARSIIGEEREEILGDLRNVEVDFEVISGEGRVMVYASSIDNGTGDSLLRTE